MQLFTYEVVRDSLYYICEEMMTELRAICISTVIREAQDCATAITDASGRLIAQSTGTPGHYNSVPSAVKGTLRKIPASSLEEGDVLITNDPWICAGHLPDIVVMTPVFCDGRLVAFTVTVAHHLDMGGKNPGSTTANTTEIYQDGLQIPPLRLVRRGQMNEAILDVVRENVRVPDVVTHDLECEIAVNTRAARRLVKLCEKYTTALVLECFETSIRNSERLMREEITHIPPGTWFWTDFLDDDGQSDEPLKVCAALTISGSDIHVDFTGSAPQVTGGINMTSSFRDSYVHLAIRCFLDPSIPHNEGCFLPVHISAPAGTIVNPLRPAAVAGRSVLISRVVDTVMACLAQAVPERAVAGYGGCNAQPVVSGISPRTGRYFIFLDSNWGGLGGRHGRDGTDCLSFPQNVGNHPIEVLEAAYPVQIERYEIRKDSGGPGTFRGGLGSVKDYRILAEARLQVPGDRTKLPPFGLNGGGQGALTEYIRVRDGVEEALRTKREYTLAPGDVLSVRTSGGGGLYPAPRRDSHVVARDVALGYISVERARTAYGAVVDPTGEVDEIATTRLRQQMEDGPELMSAQ